jgi:phosphomannomutase
VIQNPESIKLPDKTHQSPMPSDLSQVFKAYDIRGLSPGQLDEAFARRLGQVLAAEYKPKLVLVGRDMRSTTPELEAALIDGLTGMGVDVVKIGLCSSPMFYVSVGLGEGLYDLGVMVTASHNPAKYNGFKMMHGDMVPIGEGMGMETIRDRFLSEETFEGVRASGRKGVGSAGTVTEDADALKKYLDKVCSFVDVKKLPAMKIAADAGNGMNGFILPELVKRIPQVTILPLYWKLDGRFPNHEANPLKTETLKELSDLVRKEKCAFGASFDGDGDRVGFVDEKGRPIPGDLMEAILARPLLADAPGSKVLYNVNCSWTTVDEIKAAGGVPEMSRVGHALIKQQMRETKALFAGEISMHYFFGALWNMESSDLCLLLLMKILAGSGKPLSELWRPLRHFFKTQEINSEVADKVSALKRVQDAFTPTASSVSTMDGVRMEFGINPDGTRTEEAWWFCVRPSNTEPFIRLIVEASSEDKLAKKRDQLLKLIRGKRTVVASTSKRTTRSGKPPGRRK